MIENLEKEYENAKKELHSAFEDFKKHEIKCFISEDKDCINRNDRFRLQYSELYKNRELESSDCISKCLKFKENGEQERFALCQEECMSTFIPKIKYEAEFLKEAAKFQDK